MLPTFKALCKLAGCRVLILWRIDLILAVMVVSLSVLLFIYLRVLHS
jgi:hypothetical protein